MIRSSVDVLTAANTTEMSELYANQRVSENGIQRVSQMTHITWLTDSLRRSM